MTHSPLQQKTSLSFPRWKLATALALVAGAVLSWVPGAVAQSSGPGATGPVVAPDKPVVAPEKNDPQTAKTPAAPKTEKPHTRPQEEKSPKQKPSSAAAGSGSAATEKSLDDELLGELSDGLFGPVEDELFRQGVKKSPGKKRPEKPSGDGKPSPAPHNPEKESPPAADEYPELNQPEGEDIGPQDNPLASISRQMQQVERLLASRRVDEQTVQMQREIVKRLEKLLQQAQRRSPRSGSGQQQPQRQQAASRPASRRDSVKLKPSSQAAAGQPKKGGAQAAQQPNPRAEKTQEKGPRTPKPKEKKRNLVQDLVKRIWGHLPPRMRQQMLQSASDRFLPQYQLEIEEYFKRVSRARADQP